MENEMNKDTPKEYIWKIVERQARDIISENEECFSFNQNSMFVFFQKFEKYIDMIKTKFMSPEVKDLDRHKVAAIIICSIIESEIIQLNYICNDEEAFIGNEKLAVTIGLSYMRDTLKRMLQGVPGEEAFEEYHFPEPFACNTKYINILCRNLFYSYNEFMLNPIDLANELFLLEYISLLQCGIDLDVLREKSQSIDLRG